MLTAAGKKAGTWSQAFPGDADETFQLYYQAKYVNEIAAAAKAEFPIPYYINVWIDYPPAELPQRQLDTPGIGYPSGGAVQKMVGLWRKLSPSIEMIGPDIYADDSEFYRETMRAYKRPDNPLWIPETGRGDSFAKSLFYALERAQSVSRPSAWINPAGTFSGRSRGKRMRGILLCSRP